eukprot:6184549-Pleurochrysis_carterae.AAC.2
MCTPINTHIHAHGCMRTYVDKQTRTCARMRARAHSQTSTPHSLSAPDYTTLKEYARAWSISPLASQIVFTYARMHADVYANRAFEE